MYSIVLQKIAKSPLKKISSVHFMLISLQANIILWPKTFYGEKTNRPYLVPGRPGYRSRISGWPGFKGVNYLVRQVKISWRLFEQDTFYYVYYVSLRSRRSFKRNKTIKISTEGLSKGRRCSRTGVS